MGLSMVLQSSSLLVVESWDFLPSSQCIFVRVRPSCFLLVKMCLCQVSHLSRWRPRYLKSQQQGLAMVLATKFFLITWTCLVLPSTLFHASWCEINTTIAWALAVTWFIVLTKMECFQPGHKTWCFLYNPQLKRQSPPGNSHLHQERRHGDRTGQKARQCFFDSSANSNCYEGGCGYV
jgi:hypothetical protein